MRVQVWVYEVWRVLVILVGSRREIRVSRGKER